MRQGYRRKEASRYQVGRTLVGTVFILSFVAAAFTVAVLTWLPAPNLHLYAPGPMAAWYARAFGMTGLLALPLLALAVHLSRDFLLVQWPNLLDRSKHRAGTTADDCDQTTLKLTQNARYARTEVNFGLTLAAIGAMVINCGIAAYALSRDDTTWGLDLLLGAGILVASAAMVTKRVYAIRRPKTVTIDAGGMLVSWLMPQNVPWQRVGGILVRWEAGNKNLPETHWIEFYPVQDGPPPKPLLALGHGKKARILLRRTAPTILVIRPRADLGLSPTVVLDALAHFCPPSVQIHDPLRIVEERQA